MSTTAKVITINVPISDILPNIKHHLAVIGKRAKRADGTSMYSDLTTSTAEDANVWNDLVCAGAEVLVAGLSYLSSTYSNTDKTIKFYVSSDNWTDENEGTYNKDLTSALTDAIKRYLWNYAIKEFLAMIHPSTGEKYPPIFASTYQSAIVTSLAAIQNLAYLRRASKQSTKTYAAVKSDTES